MCLYPHKPNIDIARKLKKQDPNGWLVCYKFYDCIRSEVYTPYTGYRIYLGSQVVKASGHVYRDADGFAKGTVNGGAIHAYLRKSTALRNAPSSTDVVVRVYIQHKDIVSVGVKDIAAKKIVIDHRDLNKLRRRVGLSPIKFK